MMASEQFREYLRDALAHLYDPNRLRRSPLVPLFGVADQANPYMALQRILIEAISSLEPKPDVPSHSPLWRIYELLFCRYVQQLGAQEVADQMGLSVRQVRRAQNDALDALAQRLWEQFDLETRLQEAAESTAPRAAQAGLTIDEELAWLRDAPLDEPADLAQELPAVLDLVGPLATQHRAQLVVEAAAGLPALAVHPAALNQMLLSLANVAISWASGGTVTLSIAMGEQPEIRVRAEYLPRQPKSLSDNDLANLEMALKLAAMSGGRLEHTVEEGVLTACLTLPASEQLVVLAIDDNADTLRLLQRHTAGTRFHVIGTSDPDAILGLVGRFSPQIILLDVMMPRVDGWRVLGRLRQHPLTSRIPVIVCTILAQEDLALSLGASGFVRKPLSQQDLLAALNRQAACLRGPAAPAAPESR